MLDHLPRLYPVRREERSGDRLQRQDAFSLPGDLRDELLAAHVAADEVAGSDGGDVHF